MPLARRLSLRNEEGTQTPRLTAFWRGSEIFWHLVCETDMTHKSVNDESNLLFAHNAIFLNFTTGGLYAIYNHKNSIGKAHFQTTHSIAGLVVLGGCFMSGMAGGVFLHPDFGMDKTNKTIRFAHMWMSRFVLIIAWFNAFIGLTQLTEDPTKLAAYGLPLLALLFPSFM